jgi:torulene dioxygenase
MSVRVAFFTHERLFIFSSSTVLVVWQADYKMGGLSIMINEAISVNTFTPWSEKRKTLFFVIDRQKGGVVGR